MARFTNYKKRTQPTALVPAAERREFGIITGTMQRQSELRPVFWKFKLKRNYKAHLSVQVVGQMGSGTMTLCGTRIVGIQGSARTVLNLEGDECARCAEKMGRIAGN